MDKLKILVNGKEAKINITEKFAKGIFLVTENKLVKRNCDILKIILEGTYAENEARIKLTRLEKCSIVTMNVLTEWVQYIILDYTSKEDFESFHSNVPERARSVVRDAYNWNKMKTLNDIDLLGGPLNNNN